MYWKCIVNHVIVFIQITVADERKVEIFHFDKGSKSDKILSIACLLSQAAANTIDYIIDTVSFVHPLDKYLSLLKINGKLVLVGLPDKPLQFSAGSLITGKSVILLCPFLILSSKILRSGNLIFGFCIHVYP